MDEEEMSTDHLIEVCRKAIEGLACEIGNYGFGFKDEHRDQRGEFFRSIQAAIKTTILAGHLPDWLDGSKPAVRPAWVSIIQPLIQRKGRYYELSPEAFALPELDEFWTWSSFYQKKSTMPGDTEMFKPGTPVLTIDSDKLPTDEVLRFGEFFSCTIGGLSSGRFRRAANRWMKKQMKQPGASDLYIPLLALDSIKFFGPKASLVRLIRALFESVNDESSLRDFVPGHWVDRVIANPRLTAEDLLAL